MSRIQVVLIASLFLTACPPQPDVPVPPDVDGGTDADPVLICYTPAGCACANLCLLNCKECRPECEDSVNKIIVSGISYFDTDCVSEARSQAEVGGCPMIECVE